MKVELRKVKVYDEMSRETTAFNAELWIDGKLAATCMNDGGGGGHMIRYVDRHHGQSAYETAFDAWTMDADLWIGDEVERIALEKQLRRSCGRNTLRRLEGDGPNEWRTFKPAMKYTPEFGVQLRAKHGANLIEIINERFVK